MEMLKGYWYKKYKEVAEKLAIANHKIAEQRQKAHETYDTIKGLREMSDHNAFVFGAEKNKLREELETTKTKLGKAHEERNKLYGLQRLTDEENQLLEAKVMQLEDKLNAKEYNTENTQKITERQNKALAKENEALRCDLNLLNNRARLMVKANMSEWEESKEIAKRNAELVRQNESLRDKNNALNVENRKINKVIAICGTGAKHPFISHDRVKELMENKPDKSFTDRLLGDWNKEFAKRSKYDDFADSLRYFIQTDSATDYLNEHDPSELIQDKDFDEKLEEISNLINGKNTYATWEEYEEACKKEYVDKRNR